MSLVLCTFNPDKEIFKEAILSLEKLMLPENVLVECIIVDNNSSFPIESIPFVKSFQERFGWIKIIKEQKQGLSFARIAGIQLAKFSTVVFVDDDNALDRNYLINIQYCLDQYPAVAVWGPGNIDVAFSQPVPNWFNSKIRKKFQERHSEHVEYGCCGAKWMPFYPFGTGMVVQKEVLDSYREAVKNHQLSAQGRTGKNLSSGEDIQIVWEAVKMGRAAGTSPNLKVRHLIPEKRTSLKYIKKLTFGTASSYAPSLVESFPEMREATIAYLPSNYKILTRTARCAVKHSIKLQFHQLQVELADYLGNMLGAAKAINSPQEKWIRKMAEILKIS